MNLWAFSVYVHRQIIEQGVLNLGQRHTCAMIEAENRDEAAGKALRIATKLFPIREGWLNHHVCVSPSDNVVGVESVILTEE